MEKSQTEKSLSQLSKDVEQLKSKQETSDSRITNLETKVQLQEQALGNLVKSLDKIEENTVWLRQTITRAVIFGLVGVVFSVLTAVIMWGLRIG
ncbi:hemolysin XhlA family protein [Alkalihalobacillus sp. 1P02AB]|uniref:hemolysin XhlA family protein n=1 Tax=Alkalihalobacillus sp. 1P02AB TaxID=3132260 RepID=UPI0039A72B9D